jgi:hypothetical protein
MLRTMLLLGWLLGCGGSQSGVDARTDPAICKMRLEDQIDRTCAVPSDCVLVDSEDCCGTIKLAVRSGTQAAFPATEAMYSSCLACPPLGCQHADQAEDGATPGSGQSIVATCELNRCKSVVR